MAIKEIIYIFVTSFVALFPVINPIGSAFIVDGFFKDLNAEQRRTAAKKIVVHCVLIGIGSLLLGHFILELFGLAVPVIQVGGGFIICKTGMEWLSGTGSASEIDEKVPHKISMQEVEKKLFYPLSFPIVIGAGSISVIFTLMANTAVKGNLFETGINYSIIAFVICVMLVILYISLVQGHKIKEKLGESGNLVINKLIAFITFCIGIQIFVTGISKIFHIPIL
ncbi:MAG: MarC family protein [Bacteroidales bacterium]|jgi:MarC family membrane protein|nr:MarC family protein [Bacteroidales bacterium]